MPELACRAARIVPHAFRHRTTRGEIARTTDVREVRTAVRLITRRPRSESNRRRCPVDAEIMRRVVDIPWAKIAYSGVLAGIAAVLLVEIARTWRAQGVAVGTFTYYTDGFAKPDLGTAFGAQIAAVHRLLLHELEKEQEIRREEAAAAKSSQIVAWWPVGSALLQPASNLSDLELKLQGFDFGGLLKWLRSRVRPANEIRGTVDKTGSVLQAAVSWPSGPARGPRDDKIDLKYFATRAVADDHALATEIASSLIWAEAARSDEELSRVSREEFVGWARAFHHYRQLKHRAAAGILQGDDDAKLRQRARELLDGLIASGPAFPEVFRLRADVIRTSADPQPDELKIADEDRQKYLALVGVKAALAPAPAALAPERSVPPREIAPGVAVTAHGAFDWGARITAVVEDDNGAQFVLLPAVQGAERTRYLSLDGSPSTAFADLERIVRLDETKPEDAGIALFRLRAAVASSNRVDATVLSAIGESPKVGDPVLLVTPGRRERAAIAAIETALPGLSTGGVLAITNRPITSAGDAGAPIVDQKGQLVGMALAASSTGSVLMPLKPFMDSMKVRLK